MSRHNETIGRLPNPSQYFLEWSTEQNSFCYYSSETDTRIPFALPFRFLALKFTYSITGFDEGRKLGIYSNEVNDTRYEHFRVSLRDGSIIANGLYSDIKEDLKKAGGKFTRSIYAMTPKGVIVNIRIKGGQMVNFGAIEKFGNRWRDEWIQVAEFETKIYKDGDQEKEYTLPVFSFGGTIPSGDESRAEKAYTLIKDYFASKPASNTRPSQSAPASNVPAINASKPNAIFTPGSDDDLPF